MSEPRAADRGWRAYWGPVLRDQSAKRPPVVVLGLLIAMITVFYVAGEQNRPGRTAMDMIYIPSSADKTAAWYRSLSAMFSHVSTTHLWMNAAMLLFLGSLFEFTEGVLHTLAVVWGAGNLGFALHGTYKPLVMVRGMSGAIYGIIFAQISLLALNWAEMPLRWLRVILILLLAGADAVTYFTTDTRGTSYEAHLFGALAGISVALVMGRNVRFHHWELTFTWGGVVGFAALIAVAFATAQTWPAILSSAELPFLIGYAAWLTRRVVMSHQEATLTKQPLEGGESVQNV